MTHIQHYFTCWYITAGYNFFDDNHHTLALHIYSPRMLTVKCNSVDYNHQSSLCAFIHLACWWLSLILLIIIIIRWLCTLIPLACWWLNVIMLIIIINPPCARLFTSFVDLDTWDYMSEKKTVFTMRRLVIGINRASIDKLINQMVHTFSSCRSIPWNQTNYCYGRCGNETVSFLEHQAFGVIWTEVIILHHNLYVKDHSLNNWNGVCMEKRMMAKNPYDGDWVIDYSVYSFGKAHHYYHYSN